MRLNYSVQVEGQRDGVCGQLATKSSGRQLTMELCSAQNTREADTCLHVSLSFQNAVEFREYLRHNIVCKTKQISY